jgi:hypothetical protein
MVSEIVETAYIRNRARGWPIEDFLNIAGVRFAAVAGEDMAEESRFCLEELTLLDVQDKVGVGQGGEDLLEMVNMLFEGSAEDENIVHVHNDKLIDE